jgi:hypothetical protein
MLGYAALAHIASRGSNNGVDLNIDVIADH